MLYEVITKYKSEQIKDSELDAIIEAAVYAPTALNEQPWHFTVIQNKELIDEINTVSKKMLASNQTALKNLPERLRVCPIRSRIFVTSWMRFASCAVNSIIGFL